MLATTTASPAALAAAPAAAASALPAHRSVDPGRSAGWWADATLMLWRHALRWLALGGVLMLVLGLAGMLPWVGPLAAAWLTPLFLAGWMRLAHDAQAGVPPGLRGLFAGFGPAHRRPLLVLGAGLAASTLFVQLGSRLLGLTGVLGAVGVDTPESVMAQAQLGHGMLALLLLLTFSLVVSAALWFAPALVVLRGATPAAAMLASLRAVRDNTLTFVLYAVVQLLLSAVATLPYHVGWLLMVPVMLLTTYVSYRDVFEA